MTLGDYIREYRREHNCTMDDFANRSGLSKAYVSILERNRNPSTGKAAVPSLSTIKRVATATGVDFNDIIAMLDKDTEVAIKKNPATVPDGFQPLPETSSVPRVGRIACGEPITAEENIEGYDEVPVLWRSDFTLECCGDSMLPKIQDGDVVAIRKQEIVENGEIAAVRIDGEATLKHVYLHPGYIELRPENPAYQSTILIGEDMNNVHIEGKAVGLLRKL